MNQDSRPGDLASLYPHKRTVFRFDPTVSSGTLIQIAVLLGGGIITYGTYQADRATSHLEVEQIKAAAADEKAATRLSLTELRSDVKDSQKTLTQISQTLAVIESRQQGKAAGRP
jgi:uncharacterized protein HemX